MHPYSHHPDQPINQQSTVVHSKSKAHLFRKCTIVLTEEAISLIGHEWNWFKNIKLNGTDLPVTGQLADKPTRRKRNCHRNLWYKIVWAHGCVFPVNLWKKSGALHDRSNDYLSYFYYILCIIASVIKRSWTFSVDYLLFSSLLSFFLNRLLMYMSFHCRLYWFMYIYTSSVCLIIKYIINVAYNR